VKSAGQTTSFAYASNAGGFTTGATQTSDVAPSYPPTPVLQSASYNNLNQLTNLSGQTLTFDANGNLTSDGDLASRRARRRRWPRTPAKVVTPELTQFVQRPSTARRI
jgi:hypothetical protein